MLNRVKVTGDGFENHHILPKCFGGINDESNRVFLTPREHFVAHKLLVYIYEGTKRAKMCYALKRMCGNHSKTQDLLMSARMFENVRKAQILR